MLFALGDPPASVCLDILVVIAHGVHSESVFAVFFSYLGGNGIADACGVCLVNKVYHLLSVLMK